MTGTAVLGGKQDFMAAQNVVFLDDAADKPHQLVAMDVGEAGPAAAGDAAPDRAPSAPKTDQAVERRQFAPVAEDTAGALDMSTFSQIAGRPRYDDGVIHEAIKRRVEKTITALEIECSNSKGQS